MTQGERRQWLSEINRIHIEEHHQRQKEVMEQAKEIAKLRRQTEEEERIQW
jgi:hypothetical protein